MQVGGPGGFVWNRAEPRKIGALHSQAGRNEAQSAGKSLQVVKEEEMMTFVWGDDEADLAKSLYGVNYALTWGDWGVNPKRSIRQAHNRLSSDTRN